ncbi:MAG: ribosome maturation factor RimM [Thermotogota bacterium]
MKRLDNLLDNKISIGRIVNNHGLDGLVKFMPFTNIGEMVFNLEEITLYNPENKKFFMSKVEEVKPLNRFFVLKLSGLKSIEDAKKMMGFQVYVPYEDLPELDEDEYYIFQLMNSEVYYEDGEYIGVVEDILETGANDVIQIKSKDGEEVLIPLVKDYIIDYDLENKKITTKRIEYYDED